MTRARLALLLVALLVALPVASAGAADIRPSPNVLSSPVITGTITGTYTLGGTVTGVVTSVVAGTCITVSGSGEVTVATCQNLATTAAPTFAGLTLTGPLAMGANAITSTGTLGVGATTLTGPLAMGGNAITGTGAITPNVDDGGALGSATLGFSDLYLASGGTIRFSGTLIILGGNMTLGATDTVTINNQLRWNADGSGDIGALAALRPDNVYVKTAFGAAGLAGLTTTVVVACNPVTQFRTLTLTGGLITSIGTCA